MNKKTYQLIRRSEALKLTGRSKSSFFLDEKAGLMPSSISIGERAVAYLKHEIEAVIQARIQGKSPKEIKQLVADLVQQRQQGKNHG